MHTHLLGHAIIALATLLVMYMLSFVASFETSCGHLGRLYTKKHLCYFESASKQYLELHRLVDSGLIDQWPLAEPTSTHRGPSIIYISYGRTASFGVGSKSITLYAICSGWLEARLRVFAYQLFPVCIASTPANLSSTSHCASQLRDVRQSISYERPMSTKKPYHPQSLSLQRYFYIQ